MRREISSRETLVCYFGGKESLAEHGISPILAIVVDGEPPLLCGILLLFLGSSLDDCLDVTVHHLIVLLETVKHLVAAGVVHGDICERNVCVTDDSIQLIDFGEIAPDYMNDTVAAGHLLLRCAEKVNVGRCQRNNWMEAGRHLIEGDIKTALAILRLNSLSS